MSISREGLDLLKSFEGFRPKAVAIAGGRWVVGYGHTRYARSGAKVTQEEAELLLRHDLVPVIHELNTRIYAPLSQNQFDALALFAFNVGLEAFRDSQISAHLNAGETLAAARQMAQWRTALIDGKPIVVDALVRRRAAEQDLFLRTGDEVRPASSRLVTPLRDGGVVAEPGAAQNIMAQEAPSETETAAAAELAVPPKPPSTLRTRFYDLLRARRPARWSTPSVTIGPADTIWAGPAILGLAAFLCLLVFFVGFGELAAARKAGLSRPVVALALAFAGGAGALACAAAALRLAPGKRAQEHDKSEDANV